MGGDEFINRIFDTCYKKAFRAANAVLFDPGAAEDAVAEALVRLWRAYEKDGVNGDTAEGYFMRIAVNEAKRIYVRRRELPSEQVERYIESLPPQDDYREDARELLSAVERLPQTLRLPVRLHYYGGFTEVEAAELLGISYSAIKVRIMRARSKLKAELERQEGGSLNEV